MPTAALCPSGWPAGHALAIAHLRQAIDAIEASLYPAEMYSDGGVFRFVLDGTAPLLAHFGAPSDGRRRTVRALRWLLGGGDAVCIGRGAPHLPDQDRDPVSELETIALYVDALTGEDDDGDARPLTNIRRVSFAASVSGSLRSKDALDILARLGRLTGVRHLVMPKDVSPENAVKLLDLFPSAVSLTYGMTLSTTPAATLQAIGGRRWEALSFSPPGFFRRVSMAPSDVEALAAAHAAHLEELVLDIRGASFAEVARPLQAMRQLTSLTLVAGSGPSSIDVAALLTCLPRLRALDLTRGHAATATAIAATSSFVLERLCISMVQLSTLAPVLRASPRLRELVVGEVLEDDAAALQAVSRTLERIEVTVRGHAPTLARGLAGCTGLSAVRVASFDARERSERLGQRVVDAAEERAVDAIFALLRDWATEFSVYEKDGDVERFGQTTRWARLSHMRRLAVLHDVIASVDALADLVERLPFLETAGGVCLAPPPWTAVVRLVRAAKNNAALSSATVDLRQVQQQGLLALNPLSYEAVASRRVSHGVRFIIDDDEMEPRAPRWPHTFMAILDSDDDEVVDDYVEYS